jgi:signal peptidase II
VSLLRKVFTDGRLAVIVVAAILLIDQVIKIWVKTTMCLHESIHITDWFYINYIENMGMAFGMQMGSKILLSVFRFVAIAVLIYYIWKQIKAQARTSYVLCLSMVLGGAMGNLMVCALLVRLNIIPLISCLSAQAMHPS